MVKSKFEFNEVVEVQSSRQCLSPINGKRGVVRGKSQSEDDLNKFAYAVNIFNKDDEVGEGWFVFEDELRATGLRWSKEALSRNETVKVVVNPKTGEGFIKDDG